MDDPFTHLSHLQRQAETLPRLFGLYGHRTKASRERRVFDSENFSFLLRGRGSLKVDGVVWPLQAPCCFRQPRGAWVDYGPRGTWWEFSLVYLQAERPRLQTAACLDLGVCTPLRPEGLPWLRQAVGQLEELAQRVLSQALPAEALDAAALALLHGAQAWQSPHAHPLGPADPLVAIRQRLENVRLPLPNLDVLAREQGLSPAGFRRRWAAHHPLAPGAYNLQCRIQEACRLLRSTPLSLAEVAAETGFTDPLYFSRRFRHRVGEPPGAYRRRLQGPGSPPTPQAS